MFQRQNVLDQYFARFAAFSFADEVPDSFENAKNADGFVKLTELKVGGRTSMEACCCEACRLVVI